MKAKNDGNTPLHILARFCTHQDLIKLLLPFSRESLNMPNKNGMVPYELTPYSVIRDLLKTEPKEIVEKPLQ